jgi:type IV pilus assembly protein PilC
MALYAYRAIDEDGRFSNGSADAINPVDLELRLKRMGLDLVTFDAKKESTLFTGRRITRPELITFCFHLEQLVRAGVSIIEALTDLRDSVENPAFKSTIASLLEDIEGGKKLSEAMESHPTAFDAVFIALVRAGEQSGQLPAVLAELTENLKWQDELGAAAKKAMIYPLFVGAVIFALVFVLMVFLVPQLVETLKTLSPTLPTETKVLIAVSYFMRTFWYLVLGIPAATIAVVFALARTNERFKYRLDGIALAVPFIGPLRTKIILARFSTFFALLYQAGISVQDCIQISEKIVGNRVIEEGLQRVGREITEGSGLTQAFQNARLFPPLVVRMLRVGESTSALDVALRNVSYFYNRDVKETLAKMQEMIQPMLTVGLGGIFILIIMTIFSPIYEVISKIKF